MYKDVPSDDPRTRSSSYTTNRESVTTKYQIPLITEEKKNILVSNFASIIVGLILFNKEHKDEMKPNDEDILYSQKIPLLRIEEYLNRIVKYTRMEYSNLVNTFIYLDRFFLKENFVLCLNNVYKLILACVVLSIKFNEDTKFKNIYYARIGGISLDEMNEIELNIYYRLDYDLFVRQDEYMYYLNKLLNYNKEKEEDE